MRSTRPSGSAFILAAMLFPLGCFVPAQAQVIESPYRFIEARHGAGGLVAHFGENRGALRLGPGGGIAVGGRYAFELTGPIAIEATTFLLFTDREVYDPRGGPGAAQLVGTTDSYIGGFDARARFNLTGPRTWRGLAPFLTVGGGIVQDLAGRSGLEEGFTARDRFNFGPSAIGILGAGTRWIPTERLTFRLDAVLQIWKLGTPPAFIPADTAADPVESDEWVGVSTLLLGVTIPF